MNRKIYIELNSIDQSILDASLNRNSSLRSDYTTSFVNELDSKKIQKNNFFPKSIFCILVKLNLRKFFIIIFLLLMFSYYTIFWRVSYHKYTQEINLDIHDSMNFVFNKCRIYFSESDKPYNYLKIDEMMVINETLSVQYFKTGFKKDLNFYYNPRQKELNSCKIEFFLQKEETFHKKINIRCNTECTIVSSFNTKLSLSNLSVYSIVLNLRFFNIYDSEINLSSNNLTLDLINTKKNVVMNLNTTLCLAYVYNKDDDLTISYKTEIGSVSNNVTNNYAFNNQYFQNEKSVFCLTNNSTLNCEEGKSLFINFFGEYKSSFYTGKNENPDIDQTLNNLEIEIPYLKIDEILKLIVNNIDKKNFLMKLNIFHLSLLNFDETQLIFIPNGNLNFLYIKKFLRYENSFFENDMKYFSFNIQIISNADQYDLMNLTDSQKIIYYQKLHTYISLLLKNYSFNGKFKLFYTNNKLEFGKISALGQNAKIYISYFFYFFIILFLLVFSFTFYLLYRIKNNLNIGIRNDNKERELNIMIEKILKNNFLMLNFYEVMNPKKLKGNKKLQKMDIYSENYDILYDYYHYLLKITLNNDLNSFLFFLDAVCFKEKGDDSYFTCEKQYKIEFVILYKKYVNFCLRKDFKIVESDNFEIITCLESIGYRIEDSLNEFEYFITNIEILNIDDSNYFKKMNYLDNEVIFDSLEFFINKFTRKTIFSENKISFEEFKEIYHYCCDKFFLGKKKFDIINLEKAYNLKVSQKSKKYIVQKNFINSVNYYFDFFYLNQYFDLTNNPLKKDKNHFFIESLIFKKEESKISFLAYFLFSCSIFLSVLYLYDLFFYFKIFFNLENLIFVSKVDKLFASAMVEKIGLKFDLDFYLLFLGFIIMIVFNFLYTVGIYLQLKYKDDISHKFNNFMSGVFQFSFFIGLFIFLNYYIFDQVITIFIYLYLASFYSFYYLSKFLCFFIKIIFLLYFFKQLKLRSQKFHEIFSDSFEEFRLKIYNDYLEQKQLLEFYSDEKIEDKNKEFHFTLDNLIIEKSITIEEILNNSKMEKSLLVYFKNYFLIQNKSLDFKLFFEKYLCFIKLDNRDILNFLTFCFEMLKSSEIINKKQFYNKLIQLIKLFCDVINPSFIQDSHLFLNKNSGNKSILKDLLESHNNTQTNLKDNSEIKNFYLSQYSEFNKKFSNLSDIHRDYIFKQMDLESKRESICWSKNNNLKKNNAKNGFGIDKQDLGNALKRKSVRKKRKSTQSSNTFTLNLRKKSLNHKKESQKSLEKRGKNQQNPGSFNLESMKNNSRYNSKEYSIFKLNEDKNISKRTNFIFLIFLLNIEKMKGRLNLFYEKLNIFYMEFYHPKFHIQINAITFFIRNFANQQILKISDNIDKFNELIINTLTRIEEKIFIKDIIKILKDKKGIQMTKNPKNLTNFFKEKFSLNAFFDILLNSKLLDSSSLEDIKIKKQKINQINENLFKKGTLFISQTIQNHILKNFYGFELEFLKYFKKIIYYFANPQEFEMLFSSDLNTKFEKNFGNLGVFCKILSIFFKFKDQNKNNLAHFVFGDEFFFDQKYHNPVFIHFLFNLLDNQYSRYMRKNFEKNNIAFFDMYEKIMESDHHDLLKIYKRFQFFKTSNLKIITKIQTTLKNDKRNIRYMDIEDFYSYFPKLSKNLKKFFELYFILKDLKFKNLKNFKKVFLYFARLFEINSFLEEDFKLLNIYLIFREEMIREVQMIKTIDDLIKLLYKYDSTHKMFLKTLIDFAHILYTKNEKKEKTIANLIKSSFALEISVKNIRIYLQYLRVNFLKILPYKNKKALQIKGSEEVFDVLSIDLSFQNKFSKTKIFWYFKKIKKLCAKNSNQKNIFKSDKEKILDKIDRIKFGFQNKFKDNFNENYLELKNYLLDQNEIEIIFIFDFFYFFKDTNKSFLVATDLWFDNIINNNKIFKDGIIFFIIDFILRGKKLKNYELSLFLKYIQNNIFNKRNDKNMLELLNISFFENLGRSRIEDFPDLNTLNAFINNDEKSLLIQFFLEMKNGAENSIYKIIKKNRKFYLNTYQLDITEIYTLFHYINKDLKLKLDLLPNYKNKQWDKETKNIVRNFAIIANPDKFKIDSLTKNYLLSNSELFKKLNLSINLCWIGVLFKRKEIELAKLFLIKKPFSKIYKGEFLVKIICQIVYLIKTDKKEFLEKRFADKNFLENEYFNFDSEFFNFLWFDKKIFFPVGSIKIDENQQNEENNKNNEFLILSKFFYFFFFFSLKYVDCFKLEFLYDFCFNNSILKKIENFKRKKYNLQKEFQFFLDFFLTRKKIQSEIFINLLKNSKIISASFCDSFNKEELDFLSQFEIKISKECTLKEKFNFMLNKFLLISFSNSSNINLIGTLKVLEKKNILSENFFDIKEQIFTNQNEENDFLEFLQKTIIDFIFNADQILKNKSKSSDCDHCKLDNEFFTVFFLILLINKLRKFNEINLNDLNKNSTMIIILVDVLNKILQKHIFLFSKKEIILRPFDFVKYILLSLKIILPKEMMSIFSLNFFDPLNMIFLLSEIKKVWDLNINELPKIFDLNPSKKMYLKLSLLKMILEKDEANSNKVKFFRNYVFTDNKINKDHFYNLKDDEVFFPLYYNFFTKAKKSIENFYFLEIFTILDKNENKIFFYQNIPNYFIDPLYFSIQIIQQNQLKNKYKNLIDIKEIYIFYFGNDFANFEKRNSWIRLTKNYFKLYEKMNIFDISLENFYDYNENLIDFLVLSKPTKKYLKLYKNIFNLQKKHSNDNILKVFRKMKSSLNSDLNVLVYVFEFLLNSSYMNFVLFDYLQLKNPILKNIILLFHQKNSSKEKMIDNILDKEDFSVSSLKKIKDILNVFLKDKQEDNIIKRNFFNQNLYELTKYFVQDSSKSQFENLFKILLDVNNLKYVNQLENQHFNLKKLFQEYLEIMQQSFSFNKRKLLKLNQKLFNKNCKEKSDRNQIKKKDSFNFAKSDTKEVIIRIDNNRFTENENLSDLSYLEDFSRFELSPIEKNVYPKIILFLNFVNKKNINEILIYMKQIGLKKNYCEFLCNFIFHYLVFNNFTHLEEIQKKDNFILILLYKIINDFKEESGLKEYFIAKLQNLILNIKIEELEISSLIEKTKQINFIEKFFKYPLSKSELHLIIKNKFENFISTNFKDLAQKNNTFIIYIYDVLLHLFDKRNSFCNIIANIDLRKDEKLTNFILTIINLKYSISFENFPIVKRLNEDLFFFEYIQKNCQNLNFNCCFKNESLSKIRFLYFPILLLVNTVFPKFINILYKKEKTRKKEIHQKNYVEFIFNFLIRIFEGYNQEFFTETQNSTIKNEKIKENNQNEEDIQVKIYKDFENNKEKFSINQKNNNIANTLNDDNIHNSNSNSFQDINIGNIRRNKHSGSTFDKDNQSKKNINSERNLKKKISIDEKQKFKEEINVRKIITHLREFEMIFITNSYDNLSSLISIFKEYYKDEIKNFEKHLCENLEKNNFFENLMKLFKKLDDQKIKKKKQVHKFIGILINYIEKNCFKNNPVLMNAILFLENDPQVAEIFSYFLNLSPIVNTNLLRNFNEIIMYNKLKNDKIKILNSKLKSKNEAFNKKDDPLNLLKKEKMFKILDIIKNFQNLNVYINNSDIIKYLIQNINLKKIFKNDNSISLNDFFDEIKSQQLLKIKDQIGLSKGKFLIFITIFWLLTQYIMFFLDSYIQENKTFPFWLSMLLIVFVCYFSGRVCIWLMFSKLSMQDLENRFFIENSIKNLFHYYKVK